MIETAVAPAPSASALKRQGGLRVLACASQGSGGDDEARLQVLLSEFRTTILPFSRDKKLKGFRQCMNALRSGEHDVFVLEGTGTCAGLPAILAAVLFRRPYVLSSGDAVGPFLSARFPLASPLFHLYERLLYRCSSGYIGWTPYLVGRSLSMGARRAITCPGWAPYHADRSTLVNARARIREALGIPKDSVVFGIAGSLTWSSRYQYCYGLEMIQAARRSHSKACVLIVGDGSGLAHLEKAAGEALGKTVFLTGRVRREQVPEYLAAMDMGSLPQSVDGVGSFRYTTKISEYRSVGLPFFTNHTPMAYDLDRGDIWRLPGSSPWCEEFLDALSELMSSLTLRDLPRSIPEGLDDPDFDRNAQIRKVTAFLQDVVDARLPRAHEMGAAK